MSRTSKLVPDDYASLLAEVKQRVRAAQYAALKAVNKQLVGLYWDMGRLIAERQSDASWGKAVVQRLAADLRQEYPGIRGFSVQSVWYIRKVYLTHRTASSLCGMPTWRRRAERGAVELATSARGNSEGLGA
jgi:hypothetical protein